MSKISFVRITLDDNIPPSMNGIIRCLTVISEDEDGNVFEDHQDLIDNAEFHEEKEVIAYVAKHLSVSESIVEIEHN